MRRYMLLLLALVILVAFCAPAPTYAENALAKGGRGVANILSGWLEIPKNIYRTSKDQNPFLGLTLGTAKGLGMTVVRTSAGVYDLVTFPFPIPKEYKPLLEPEYVFGSEAE